MKFLFVLIPLCLFCWCSVSFAGEADVTDVRVKENKNGGYDFSVTVHHEDTGWEHYADKWEIIGEDGTVFGTRTLHHPHVDEQPFTRSLSRVEIPGHVIAATIRAHDSVHGYGGTVITVELP